MAGITRADVKRNTERHKAHFREALDLLIEKAQTGAPVEGVIALRASLLKSFNAVADDSNAYLSRGLPEGEEG